MHRAAYASTGARRAWDGEPAGVSNGVAVRGVAERSLAAEGLLDSFFLHARARDAAGRVVGPRALVPVRRLGAKVVEIGRAHV